MRQIRFQWLAALVIAAVFALATGCSKKVEKSEKGTGGGAPAAESTAAPAAEPAAAPTATSTTEPAAAAAPAPTEKPAAAPAGGRISDRVGSEAAAKIDCVAVCDKGYKCAAAAAPAAAANEQALRACQLACAMAVKDGSAVSLRNYQAMMSCGDKACGDAYHSCLAAQVRGKAPAPKAKVH